MKTCARVDFQFHFSARGEYSLLLPLPMTLLTPDRNAAAKALAFFEHPPVPGILAASRAVAVGCGVGMMVAGKFNKSSSRQTTAITLLSLGLLGNVPSLVDWIGRLLDRPESERGARRRLQSIRESGDFDPTGELF